VLQVLMRSRPAAVRAVLVLLLFLGGCTRQHEAAPTPTLHPNPILIREFSFSPAVVTLDPSFGFSLYRGEQGVPRGQRAAGLGRAVAFNLTDAIAEYLTAVGYDVLRTDGSGVEPGMRALIVSGALGRIDEGHRRRVGAENSGVTVDVAIDFQVYGQPAQRLAAFRLDSRQVGGGLIGVSARQRGDVKVAASQLGAELGRYMAAVARSRKWPAAAR
jgi:hypothetical protein